MRWILVIGWLATACYQPRSPATCAISCQSFAECPDGLACNSQGLCTGGLGDVCGDAGVIDDAAPPDGDGKICQGTPPYEFCFPAPVAPVTIANSFTTTGCPTGQMLTPTGGQAVYCAIVGTTVVIDSTIAIKVPGDTPLVVIATGPLHVTAVTTLDLSSSRGAQPAAGAQWAVSGCSSNGNAAAAAGGGAGGSYQTAGGDGGTSGNGTHANPISPSLHGGCPAGTGGAGASNPGSSGGAVYLIGSMIVIDGHIDVSGAGGAPGPQIDRGGGGGGSGGIIVLDSGMLTFGGTATLRAVGGGGGGGKGNTIGASAGLDGKAGGSGGSPNGGTGSRVSGDPGDPGGGELESGGGTGGGGGGLGYIVLRVPTTMCPDCIPLPTTVVQ